MCIETRIRELEHDTIENTFTYNSSNIFRGIQTILDTICVNYTLDGNTITVYSLGCDVPSSKVIQSIRDKINASMIVFDHFIGIIERNEKLIIYMKIPKKEVRA